MSVRASRSRSEPAKLPKRDAILRAALEVFAEHGVNGVPVPEIAERAGVGTGTIYRFFESKEALVNEVFREQKRALGRRLADLPQELPARAQFNEFWKRIIAFVQEEPESFRFLELQDHVPYLDEQSKRLERRVLEPILAAHKALQKRGVFRRDVRPEVAITLHWGALVNLFKAERTGHLTLKPRDLISAREACWRLLAEDE